MKGKPIYVKQKNALYRRFQKVNCRLSIMMVKLSFVFLKITVLLTPQFINGLNSIQKSKQIMERFLPLNKLLNSRNKLPYSKKRTSYKKSNCHIHALLKQRLKAIELLKSKHKISRLCRALNVSRSTYYNTLNREPSKRDIENQKIRSHLLELYIKYNKRLGVIKLNRRLFVKYGISISLGRVYRLLKSMPLPLMSTVKPSFKAYKHSNDEDGINVLNQEFSPSEPNKVWVSDFTYIKTAKGFRYLCVIMDLFYRKIIAWKLSNRMNSTLILDVFYDAYNVRMPQGNLLFHSDRGSQCRSFKVRTVIDDYYIVQSF